MATLAKAKAAPATARERERERQGDRDRVSDCGSSGNSRGSCASSGKTVRRNVYVSRTWPQLGLIDHHHQLLLLHATCHHPQPLHSSSCVAALVRCLWQGRARPALNLLRAIQLSGISFQFNNLEIVAATEAPVAAAAAATIAAAVVATIAANYCIAICQSLIHSVSQSGSQSICHQSSMLVASTSSTHLTDSLLSPSISLPPALSPSLSLT